MLRVVIGILVMIWVSTLYLGTWKRKVSEDKDASLHKSPSGVFYIVLPWGPPPDSEKNHRDESSDGFNL